MELVGAAAKGGVVLLNKEPANLIFGYIILRLVGLDQWRVRGLSVVVGGVMSWVVMLRGVGVGVIGSVDSGVGSLGGSHDVERM